MIAQWQQREQLRIGPHLIGGIRYKGSGAGTGRGTTKNVMTGGDHVGVPDVTVRATVPRQDTVPNFDLGAAKCAVDCVRTAIVANRGMLNADPPTTIRNGASRNTAALIATDGGVGEGYVSGTVVKAMGILDERPLLKA